MFWMVLAIPPATLKLVELNWAKPNWVVEAGLMVMVLEEVVTLLIDTMPVRLLMEVTPPPAPPVQVWKLRAPVPLVSRQSPLAPSAVGRVKVVLAAVAPLCRVSILALVELLKLMDPLLVEAVPIVRLVPWTLRLPVSVMAVIPVWERMELAIA